MFVTPTKLNIFSYNYVFGSNWDSTLHDLQYKFRPSNEHSWFMMQHALPSLFFCWVPLNSGTIVPVVPYSDPNIACLHIAKSYKGLIKFLILCQKIIVDVYLLYISYAIVIREWCVAGLCWLSICCTDLCVRGVSLCLPVQIPSKEVMKELSITCVHSSSLFVHMCMCIIGPFCEPCLQTVN